uniref:Uncharacterized protein n=1 Tax=Steinernema glaseri TaxID=37863 RepID=A0A1I7YUQ9_9BILA
MAITRPVIPTELLLSVGKQGFQGNASTSRRSMTQTTVPRRLVVVSLLLTRTLHTWPPSGQEEGGGATQAHEDRPAINFCCFAPLTNQLLAKLVLER